MLIGLLPVFVLTVPSTLAASFQLRVDEGAMWDAIATMMLMAAALLQMFAAFVALYFIDQVKNDPEVIASDDDEEVREVEKREAFEQASYEVATQLDQMPTVPRALLLSGAAVLILSVYLIVFFSASCFESFALTDDVASALCLSCERAPSSMGWVALHASYSVGCPLASTDGREPTWPST